jgi:hypothetical protein
MFHPTMLEQLDGPWLWLCSSTMDQHVCVADVQSSMVALAHSQITGITTQFHQPPVRWSWMILGCLPLWSHHLWWSHGEVVVIHKYIYMCTYTYVFIRLYVFLYIFCPAHCWPLELSSRLRRKGNKLMQLILHGCSLHRLPVKKTNANCQEAFARHSSRPERCNSSSYIPFPVRDFWWKEQQEATTSYGDEKNICAETSRRRPDMCILIYLSVCLSVSLSVCRSVRPSIHSCILFPSLPFPSLLFSSCLVSSRLWSRLFSSLPFSYLILSYLSIMNIYIYIYIYSYIYI